MKVCLPALAMMALSVVPTWAFTGRITSDGTVPLDIEPYSPPEIEQEILGGKPVLVEVQSAPKEKIEELKKVPKNEGSHIPPPPPPPPPPSTLVPNAKSASEHSKALESAKTSGSLAGQLQDMAKRLKNKDESAKQVKPIEPKNEPQTSLVNHLMDALGRRRNVIRVVNTGKDSPGESNDDDWTGTEAE